MNQPIEWLNSLSTELFVQQVRKCCGCTQWCNEMATGRPFRDKAHLDSWVEQSFDAIGDDDWLEAFGCHPKIGDLDSLRMKYTGNREWSAGEQSGMSAADEKTILQLAEGNRDYERKFGFLFIVCASGKSASEMLTLLQARLHHSADAEMRVASEEQRKITRLRIEKLCSDVL